MNHALCILTYVSANAEEQVFARLPAALQSLEQTNYPGPVMIVDDGSPHPRQQEFLEHISTRYPVVRRGENGGICRAKNTCLRTLMERQIDVGFLAEDDIEFRPGWHEHYLAAHRALPNLHHLSWAWDNDPSQPMQKRAIRINGYTLAQTSRLNGVLLTFTPQVIQQVGGFRLLPGKWGHTHTNWTRRIIHAGLSPFFADIIDSNQFIRCGVAAATSTVSAREKRLSGRANRRPAQEVEPVYCPLIE